MQRFVSLAAGLVLMSPGGRAQGPAGDAAAVPGG
jgi:hypothetical protein